MSGQTDPTSTGKSGQCVFCPDCVAIYTCPRCATRTCSLPCSAAHKTRTGCSGVREKAKFVPMNRYTCGTMMDDYVFLEDMSRKVGEWGQDIARGGYGYGHGRGRGTLQGRRGGGRGTKTGPPLGKTWSSGGISGKKRDILKSQLELRDIEMDLLPSGMERRTLNQSSWDSKYVDYCSSYYLVWQYRVGSYNNKLFFIITGRGQLFLLSDITFTLHPHYWILVQMMHKKHTPSSPTATTLNSPYATSFSLKYPNALTQEKSLAQIYPHGSKPSHYHTQTSQMPSPLRNSSYAHRWIHCLDEVRSSHSSSWIASESFLRC